MNVKSVFACDLYFTDGGMGPSNVVLMQSEVKMIHKKLSELKG